MVLLRLHCPSPRRQGGMPLVDRTDPVCCQVGLGAHEDEAGGRVMCSLHERLPVGHSRKRAAAGHVEDERDAMDVAHRHLREAAEALLTCRIADLHLDLAPSRRHDGFVAACRVRSVFGPGVGAHALAITGGQWRRRRTRPVMRAHQRQWWKPSWS